MGEDIMGTAIRSWRVGAALAVSAGALALGSLPNAMQYAAPAQTARPARWFEWFADGQKVAQQTGKPLFVIIT
jgi:hypothetical protein